HRGAAGPRHRPIPRHRLVLWQCLRPRGWRHPTGLVAGAAQTGLKCPILLLKHRAARTFMLIVISPAKSLDYESPVRTRRFTQPDFLSESEQLIGTLRGMSAQDLSTLMSISPTL